MRRGSSRSAIASLALLACVIALTGCGDRRITHLGTWRLDKDTVTRVAEAVHLTGGSVRLELRVTGQVSAGAIVDVAFLSGTAPAPFPTEPVPIASLTPSGLTPFMSPSPIPGFLIRVKRAGTQEGLLSLPPGRYYVQIDKTLGFDVEVSLDAIE
jgi:hypothetical protein